MLLNRSPQALLMVALCSALTATHSLVRNVHAENTSVVDLNADTHHNPPASTTDKSTPGPATTTPSNNVKPKASTRDQDVARQKADAQKLKLRAGEKVGSTPQGKAQVFGMALQEGTHSRAKVVEVALNSPAFDAGVMKGDEIIAFQGFRGENYREWIDGIQRLATDTGAGLKIPVIVLRNDKQVTVQIEVQPKPALRPNGRALALPGSPVIPPGASEPAPMVIVGGNGGNNVVVDGSVGPFGEFFGGDQAASPNERAVAQIVRISGQPAPNPPTSPTAPAPIDPNAKASPSDAPTGAAVTPANGAARIGMAGFRDDPTGMVVMVDVGALPAGIYSVEINEPSVVGGAAVTAAGGVNPNVQTPPQAVPTQATVAAAATEGVVASSAPIKVVDQPQTNYQDAQASKDAAGAPRKGPGAATVNQIGTITVEQSGTGRMEQRVESVQVRNVVGQAVVLYSQNASAQPNRPITAASQPAPVAARVPAAGGIIQLVTDRRPPVSNEPQVNPAPPAAIDGSAQPPANAATPAGQNLVR